MTDPDATDKRLVRERLDTALQQMDAGNPHGALLDLNAAILYMAGILARQEYAQGYDAAKKTHGVNGGI